MITAEDLLGRLESAFEQAERNLQAQIDVDKFWPNLTPYEMKDRNGRYILLDALTVLLQTRLALGIKDEPAPRKKAPRIPRPGEWQHTTS